MQKEDKESGAEVGLSMGFRGKKDECHKEQWE